MRRCRGGRGIVPLVEPRRRSVRDVVIRWYEGRLPRSRDDDRDGIYSRAHMQRQLDRLRAGETVQLHRVEVDRLPVAYRPDRAATWTLAELRGDEVVPVPTWRPGAPRPAEWTV